MKLTTDNPLAASYLSSQLQILNWHPWQKDVYNFIYNKKGEMKKADHRTIYSLVDFDGNSGKSSYYKYLYINDPINIGRLSYGTGSQLRSAAINMGKKNCYIIDLPRTKSRADNHDDLVSVIEELKSGSVFSPMYGRNAHLIMQPPIIIISSNFVLEGTSLSKDRWQVYEILKDKKLGKKNRLLSVNNIKKKVKKSE